MGTFFVGLDLGQSSDYTARAIIERIGSPFNFKAHLRDLKRYALGTKYPDIVADTRRVLAKDELGDNPILVVDGTGVGAPVVDMFEALGMCPYIIKIHGGQEVTGDGMEFRVPKRDLATNLQCFFQNKTLMIAEGIPQADTLIQELLAFKVKINVKTGHDSYEAWREKDHDDIVLAVAMACWCMKNIPDGVPLGCDVNTEGWPEDEESDW